jgi:hypothetical protein
MLSRWITLKEAGKAENFVQTARHYLASGTPIRDHADNILGQSLKPA